LEELLFDHQFRSHPTETDKEENSSSAVDGSIQIFGQSQGSAIVVCTWTDGEVLSSDRRFSSEFSRFHILHYSSMYSRSSRVKFLTVEGNGDNVSSTKPSSRSLQEFLLKHCFFPTANMKVITAIYLHVRPDLRDEWLAGVDVDTDVEESLVRLFPSRLSLFLTEPFPFRSLTSKPFEPSSDSSIRNIILPSLLLSTAAPLLPEDTIPLPFTPNPPVLLPYPPLRTLTIKTDSSVLLEEGARMGKEKIRMFSLPLDQLALSWEIWMGKDR